MHHIYINIFRHSTILIFIFIIPTAYPMLENSNHIVKIISKINERNSCLQLHYLQRERNQNSPVGMLKIISQPETLTCFTQYPKKKKYPSVLTLSDPHSKERELKFKVTDGSFLTIHEKKENIISITGSRAKRFIVTMKEFNDHEEHIVTEASTEEKELGRFTYLTQ